MPDMGQTGRLDYPFTGICTFLRSGVAGNLARLDADVAVLGVPFDEGSPYMPGPGSACTGKACVSPKPGRGDSAAAM